MQFFNNKITWIKQNKGVAVAAVIGILAGLWLVFMRKGSTSSDTSIGYATPTSGVAADNASGGSDVAGLISDVQTQMDTKLSTLSENFSNSEGALQRATADQIAALTTAIGDNNAAFTTALGKLSTKDAEAISKSNSAAMDAIAANSANTSKSLNALQEAFTNQLAAMKQVAPTQVDPRTGGPVTNPWPLVNGVPVNIINGVQYGSNQTLDSKGNVVNPHDIIH